MLKKDTVAPNTRKKHRWLAIGESDCSAWSSVSEVSSLVGEVLTLRGLASLSGLWTGGAGSVEQQARCPSPSSRTMQTALR